MEIPRKLRPDLTDVSFDRVVRWFFLSGNFAWRQGWHDADRSTSTIIVTYLSNLFGESTSLKGEKERSLLEHCVAMSTGFATAIYAADKHWIFYA
uniref:Mitochondrial import inner membrane translocase subunit Tim17/Tim22/Tim23 family protein n=1 Tax=Ascaris lumbricoides TaxID=6252 RepID=A0A0M3HGM2_ASCLU